MPLPNLLIVGAQKSGTTWLHQALRKSRHFQTAERKEQDFFILPDFAEQLQDYAERFPDGPARYTYESSPSYFRVPSGTADHAQRIAHSLPEVEIVVLFRDPVQRYLSSYTHHMMKKRFAYAAEIDEMTDEYEMLSIGRYGEILTHWRQVFPNIRTYFYDDLKADAGGLLTQIMGDLGIDRDVTDRELSFEVNVKTRKFKRLDWPAMPKLSAELHGKLAEFYRDDIAQLQELTGRDLSHWAR